VAHEQVAHYWRLQHGNTVNKGRLRRLDRPTGDVATREVDAKRASALPVVVKQRACHGGISNGGPGSGGPRLATLTALGKHYCTVNTVDAVNIRLYALQLYVTCYITGRIAIGNFHGNHRQISRSSSGMQSRQGELEKRDGFVAHCTHRCEHTVIRPSTDDADNRPRPHRRRRHRHRLHRLPPHSGCPAT